MFLDILTGLCPNPLGVGGFGEPNVGENVMNYKWTELDGLVTQPKLERIQFLALTFIDWH
jgi:hypothetical protein